MGKKKKSVKPRLPNSTATMNIDHILAQLASLADNSRSFITKDPVDKEADDIWQADVAACEQATAILSALQDEGIEDPEQVHDLIADYNAMAEERRELHRKYEQPDPATSVGGQMFCPECNAQLHYYPRHCPGCGKRLNNSQRRIKRD